MIFAALSFLALEEFAGSYLFVILSEAKNLLFARPEILRFAQNDK